MKLLNPQGSKGHSALTLLIVDDDDTIRKMLKTVFSRFKYRVILAENGQEGVDYYRQNSAKVNLVMLDWKMPIMDGKNAFKEMRRMNPDLKIVLMSGYVEQQELDQLLDKNSQFIAKPFTIDTVIATVEAMLQS